MAGVALSDAAFCYLGLDKFRYGARGGPWAEDAADAQVQQGLAVRLRDYATYDHHDIVQPFFP